MKQFLEPIQEGKLWVFRYYADEDPSGDLHSVGAHFSGDQIHDISGLFRSKKAEFSGTAYSTSGTKEEAETIQTSLLGNGWKRGPITIN
jgi:hypothetical protein